MVSYFFGAAAVVGSFFGGFCGIDLGLLCLELDLLLHLASVADEFLCGRKFTEAVSNHVLGDQYFYMLSAIVDAESESNHFRRNLAERRDHVFI